MVTAWLSQGDCWLTRELAGQVKEMGWLNEGRGSWLCQGDG